MANKSVISSVSKKIGKSIAFIKSLIEEMSSAKKILEEDNGSKKTKNLDIDEVSLFIDDAVIEAQNLQKDLYGIGLRLGGAEAISKMEEAEKFRIFCSLKDLYKDNGLPYYFVSYEKTLQESVSSMYMSNIPSLGKNAQQIVVVIVEATNKAFGTSFSSDTLRNTSSKALVDLIFAEKNKDKGEYGENNG